MSKGGSSTSVEIPDYIENAARNNLQRADFVSKAWLCAAKLWPHGCGFHANAAKRVWQYCADG